MTTSTPRRTRRRPGGPRRWRAADKAAHLAAFAVRGRSIAAYCAATSVPRATFTLWQREARVTRATAAPASPARPTFARVAVIPAPRPSALTVLVRRRDGLEVEVTGLDAATLAIVLPAVLGTAAA